MRRADLCYAARVGMAEGQAYQDEMTKLKWQIRNLEEP